jgi:ABC-type lipoprotein release transport system permease subunit
MKAIISIGSNILLYAFLLWLLYDSTIHEWDPWFAFVVGFVLVIAIVTSLIPSLRANGVSPGHYPEEEAPTH